MKINVLAYKCILPPNTQASYFIEVNVCGGIFGSTPVYQNAKEIITYLG